MRVPGLDARDALLLLGGTASVVGEETRHPGDVGAQIDETMDNLSALIAKGLPDATDVGTALDRVEDAIVYYVREQDRGEVEREVRARLRFARDLAFVGTDLCREDLLVEIEGIASADESASRSDARPKRAG